MHLAESSSSLFCLWTGLSLPVALHPASQRRSYLPLRTGQCSRPERTFTLLLVRTLRRTCPRHFVPGYDRTVPPGQNIEGTKAIAPRPRGPRIKLALMFTIGRYDFGAGNFSQQTFRAGGRINDYQLQCFFSRIERRVVDVRRNIDT